MTKTTKKSRKNVLFKILKSIFYVGVTCAMALLYPVRQSNTDMSGHERVFFYKVLANDPDHIIIFIVLLIFISIISISIKFIRQQK